MSSAWNMLKDTVDSFIDDEALSRGAAIAFYTVTSLAPVLLIVIAIAGLVFGRDAAQNAISAQFSGLMGRQTAEVLQSAVASAAGKSSSIIATIIGVVTLVATASGVFGEMQAALNSIWKTKPQATTVSRFDPCARYRFRVGRRLRVFADCLAGDQRRSYGFWKIFGHGVADRKADPSNTELCRVLCASRTSLWRDLQDSARQKPSMERRRDRRCRNVGPLQYREIIDWMVHWQQRDSIQLRRRRRPYCAAIMGLLLGSDILARR